MTCSFNRIFYFILTILFTFSLYGENHPQFWEWKTPFGSYQTHYLERGTGAHHVLLLHGFAAHSYTWKSMITDLEKSGYHVWSIDLLGFGLSDKPPRAPYGLQLFTDQIEAFMEAHKIDQACLIGNSMGGGLALAMAIGYPQRVQSLVLIDTFAFPIQLPFYFSITKMLGNLAKPFMGKILVKQILKQVMYDPTKITEEQVKAYTFPLHTPGGKEAFIKTLQNFDPKDLEKLSSYYQEIKIPILIIWGEKDHWIPLDHFYRLSKIFPQAKTVLIPNCGHIPQEECPEKVNQALLDFLIK